MKIGNNKGFTLIEVIVVAGIIAILAGILVPIIFKEIDESKITRASADIKSISTVMFVFRKDTGAWPLMDGNCSPTITFLTGAGNLDPNLAGLGYDTSVATSFDAHFSSNTNNCYSPNWKGPYIAQVSADPWGNAYITNANGFAIAGQPVWIISAGPNRQLETNANDTALQGDDIGVRIAGGSAGGAGAAK
ncbi:MAG: prepilin-type N-terminal cleavage/methylation domain-containing protein [Nitrospirae bacterium]|nr:MAG: prepilin-type N-terminal cleavage/methylation domain-containing protein [Nitrospirota bacterium]